MILLEWARRNDRCRRNRNSFRERINSFSADGSERSLTWSHLNRGRERKIHFCWENKNKFTLICVIWWVWYYVITMSQPLSVTFKMISIIRYNEYWKRVMYWTSLVVECYVKQFINFSLNRIKRNWCFRSIGIISFKQSQSRSTEFVGVDVQVL